MDKKKPKFIISVGIGATHSYQYALSAGAKALQQNFFFLKDTNYEGHLILATDKSSISNHINRYMDLLGIKWTIHHIPLDVEEAKEKDYKEQSNLLVAVLMNSIFCKARSLNSDYLLTNDADVILGHNVVEHMLHMLKTPYSYFDIVVSPYPSNGGGSGRAGDFLNLGFGDSQKHIYPNIYPDERKAPKRMFEAKKKWDAELKALKGPKDKEKAEKLFKKLKWWDKRIEKYPPLGNVHYLNSLKYRKRGWASDAMSGTASKGNFVETFWTGWGANMYSRRAIECLDVNMYGNLGGTVDLQVVHESLIPKGMHICSLPHTPSHHVVREKKTGKLFLAYAYHEKIDPNTKDHLRMRMIPFYNWDEGERVKSPQN